MPKIKKYAYLKEIEIKYRLKKTQSKIIGSFSIQISKALLS
jgi:hypothetical protein